VIAGTPVAVSDPPAQPNPRTYRGLAEIAFLHEQPGFRDLRALYGAPEMYERLLDHLRLGLSALVELKRGAEEQRRRPTYWSDRAMRALLFLPAYLVGLLLGESPRKIDASVWGLPLRLLGVVADVLAVYFAGHAFKLW
jgi:hypothetical protein